MRARESWDEESIDPVPYRSRQHLAEETGIAQVRSSQAVEVSRPVRFVDYCRG
jgi:hypothetical protein